MSNYFKFIESNRPSIGLTEIYDLSEIYDRDQRFALLNIGLNPDGLDQIYGLSNIGLTKEDIRTMGGLETSVINSLSISDITLQAISFDQRNFISADRQIGEPGKQSFNSNINSDNVIVIHGGLAAKSITYSFIDEDGNKRNTNVSVSRESLFNAERDNNFRFTNAEYTGLLRVRRRSHVNRINLTNKIVRQKGAIVESPTHYVNIPTYMATQLNPSPLLRLIKSYSIKNSPTILPVRISNTAQISLVREGATATSSGFVFGWELRRYSDLSLIRSASINSVGAVNRVNISINVVGTAGNNVECLLYIYLDPTSIVEADLSGLGLRELAGKDIGLVGFDSLRRLNLSNNRLSTIPVWLKTRYANLEYLNINANNFWQNGIVSVFDYQDMTGSGIDGIYTSGLPSITLAQVLGYSGFTNSGRIAEYTGLYSSVQDAQGRLYKDSRRLNTVSVDAQNGFRVYSQLRELILGGAIYVRNADFSKLFPNLTNIGLGTTYEGPKTLEGLPPKLNNNGGLFNIDLNWQRQCTGGLNYLGDGSSWNGTQNTQFIGKFNVASFSAVFTGMNGGICTEASDVEFEGEQRPQLHHVTSGSVVDAWSGWINNLTDLYIPENNIAFKIAKGTTLNWQKLRNVNIRRCGVNVIGRKVRYNAGDTLLARELVTLDAHAAGWHGNMFKIDPICSKLVNLDLSYNTWVGTEDAEGRQYLFPENFTNLTTCNIRYINLRYIYESSNIDLELRPNDFINIPLLSTLFLSESYITGTFPTISTTTQNQNVSLYLDIRFCRFRNLNSIGSSSTSRVSHIVAIGQGSGVGGSLLPSFASSSNNTLAYVNFDQSLYSTYPSNWGSIEDRGKLILPAMSNQTPETNIPQVTWTSRNNNNTLTVESNKLYWSAPAGTLFTIFSDVMVGDTVFGSGVPQGTKVTQIDRNSQYIYVNNSFTISNVSLTFSRSGQDISTYFSNHSRLTGVFLSNCRLTGQIPSFSGSPELINVYLDNNLLSSYVAGTLKNATGVSISRRNRPNLRNFILRGNPLSVLTIRRIIEEAHEIAVYYAQYGVVPLFNINLLETKLDVANKQLVNYQRGEILDDIITPKFEQLGPGKLYPGITISIF